MAGLGVWGSCGTKMQGKREEKESKREATETKKGVEERKRRAQAPKERSGGSPRFPVAILGAVRGRLTESGWVSGRVFYIGNTIKYRK